MKHPESECPPGSSARIVQRVVAVVALALVLGCKSAPSEPQEMTSAALGELRRSLLAWVESDEPDQAALEAVVEFGEEAVPSLRGMLLRGPAPARAELQRLHLEEVYGELVTAAARTGTELGLTREEYLSLYRANLLALYRSRSATALARIGGQEARRALEELLSADLREDVRWSVAEALRSME